MSEKPTYQELKIKVEKLEAWKQAAQKILEDPKAHGMPQTSENRFRTIIEEVSGISIQGYNEKRQVIFWNHASEVLYGYTEKQALGQKLEDLIIPGHMREQVKQLLQRWIEFDEKIPPGELELTHKNGYAVPVYSSHVMLETIHGKEMFCIDIDMGPIKQAEKALKTSEGLFRLITQNTSALVSIHDSNGDYIFVSPSYNRFGFNSQKLIGKSGLTMLVEQSADVLLAYLEKAKNREISRAVLNYDIRDKNGEIHNFRGSFDALFEPNGSLERIICVGEDITELRKSQSLREEALSLAAEAKEFALVGRIAGNMAHDFNNILGVIMGISEMSLMDCNDAKLTNNLNLILNQTIRGKNLTKNLVAFAKSQEPKQEFFNINEIIVLVLNLMKKDLENVWLDVTYDPQLPELLADSGMIEHALINLLQNGLHATSKSENPKITILTYCRNNHVCIEIKDNGCGIPNEYLKDIFKPSFTLKGSKDKTGAYNSTIKGTGYGLANVKKYINQHNGEIKVESCVGIFTKFTISLPVTQKSLSAEEKKQVQKETVYSNKYILIVEDEQAIADVQEKILNQDPFNHNVDIADNGQQAFHLLKNNQYDLISLDYFLPGDINGMDIYNHIRKTDKIIPIVFISGNIEFLESIKGLKHNDPYVDHLSKPCKNIEYVTTVNRLLDKIKNSSQQKS